jgi:hypothetical protein
MAMAYDDEQCPSRGVGLKHVTDDGMTCDHCGKLRIGPAMTLLEWLRSLRGNAPAVMVVSGETAPSERKSGDPDFALLSEHQWHALIVERRYHESHRCDDR